MSLAIMGSHSVSCHPTQVNTSRLNPSQRGQSALDLLTPDGSKAELAWVTASEDDEPGRSDAIFHPNFGVVPVAPDRTCWGHCERVP